MTPRDIAFILAGLVVGVAGATAWLDAPSSYEQCVLDQMRNQSNTALLGYATAVCEHLPKKAKDA